MCTNTCSVPRLASAVTLARGPRPWRGFTRGPFNNTANCPLRDYTTQKRWPKKLDNSRCVLYTKSNTLYVTVCLETIDGETLLFLLLCRIQTCGLNFLGKH